jgi:hypothetical protein
VPENRQPKDHSDMRALAYLSLPALALVLAACDAPDPSEFHHRIPTDVTLVGTHINGVIGSGEVTNNTDAHQFEQLQRNSLVNDIGSSPKGQ